MGCIIDLEINRAATPGSYDVQVVQSPAGEASAVFRLDSDLLLGRRQEVQQVLLVSSGTTRRLLTQSEHVLHDVGRELFNALAGRVALSLGLH